MSNPAKPRAVVVEREFQHPPEKLWRALTQPHLIAEWLMKNDFKANVGHRFSFNADWGGTLDCEVLEASPHTTLAYTWNHKHADPALNLESVVTFTLTPTAAGTKLRMEQAGFQPNQRQAFGGANIGWPRFLDKLEHVLTRADQI